jgi:hypothetical protein
MCFVPSRLPAAISSTQTNKLVFAAKTVWPVRKQFEFNIYIKNSSFTRRQRLISCVCLFYVGLRNFYRCLVLGQNIFVEQLPIMASSCMEHKTDENSQEYTWVFRENCNPLPSCSLQFILLWMRTPAHPLRRKLLNARTLAKASKGLFFLFIYGIITLLVT